MGKDDNVVKQILVTTEKMHLQPPVATVTTLRLIVYNERHPAQSSNTAFNQQLLQQQSLTHSPLDASRVQTVAV